MLMKIRSTLIATGTAALVGTAYAAGPHLVFETSDGNENHVAVISEISRVNFVDNGLELVGTGTHLFPLSQLRRVTVDHEGLTTPTALAEVTEASILRVTPSPAKDVISIEGTAEGDEVLIFSTAGNNVISLPHYNGGSINVSALPGGVYIVKTKTSTAKFLKL